MMQKDFLAFFPALFRLESFSGKTQQGGEKGQ
jgi:hypothetical protein